GRFTQNLGAHIGITSSCNQPIEPIPVATAPGEELSQRDCYALFVELRTSMGGYEAPYQYKQADFVQIAKTLKKCAKGNWPITRERFEKAAKNYFATPQKLHTLADLATRFDEFYKNSHNEFGKPTGENSNGRTKVPRNETHNERAARETEELFR